MTVLKLAIGLPAYGGKIIAEQARMWTEFGNTCGASNERFRLAMFGHVDVNPIDRARNLLIAQAMLHNADWLFMLDADTWVRQMPDEDAGFQILRMIADADRVGVALVSAAVVLRAKDDAGYHNLAVFDRDADGKHKPKPISWIHEQGRKLVPVDAVGAACFALNLNALKKIDPPLQYRFTDRLSEDLEFCRALREGLGERVVAVDTRVLTGHMSKPIALTVNEKS